MTKTTIEIDEAKLERVMRAAGLKTRKEVVDWALTEAERIANISRIAESPWDAEYLKDAVEPGYDVLKIRQGSVRYTESFVKPLLVDSAVYIDCLRRGRDIRQELLPHLRAGILYNSGVIRAEVLRSLKAPTVHDGMEAFFDIIPEIPTDADGSWVGQGNGRRLPIS